MEESGRWKRVVDGREWYMGESGRRQRVLDGRMRESWERLVDKRKRERVRRE